MFVFAAAGIFLCVYFYRRAEYRAVVGAAVMTIFLTAFGINSVTQLAITLTLDPVEYIRLASITAAVGLYLRFIPVIIIYAVVLGVVYIYQIFTRTTRSLWNVTLYFGYGLITMIIMINVIGSFAPQTLVEEIVFITIGTIALPLELYYILQIGVWMCSGFTFLTQMLSIPFKKGD